MVSRLPRSAELGGGCSRVMRRGRTAAGASDFGSSPAAAAPGDASRSQRSATGPQAEPAAILRYGGAVDLTGPAGRDPFATRTDRARSIRGDPPLGAADGEIGRTAGDSLALQGRKLRARPVLLPRPAERPHANVALLLQGGGHRGGETAGMLAFLGLSRRLGRFADATSSSRR
jgi:hypothetical protein